MILQFTEEEIPAPELTPEEVVMLEMCDRILKLVKQNTELRNEIERLKRMPRPSSGE